MTARLAAIVSRFVTGSAQSFNQETNVNLDNKYIVLDLSELKGNFCRWGCSLLWIMCGTGLNPTVPSARPFYR